METQERTERKDLPDLPDLMDSQEKPEKMECPDSLDVPASSVRMPTTVPAPSDRRTSEPPVLVPVPSVSNTPLSNKYVSPQIPLLISTWARSHSLGRTLCWSY